MSDNKDSYLETSVVLTKFITSNKIMTYIVIALIFIVISLMGIFYVKNTYSSQAQALSQASKTMAESLKINTESLAPIPEIVKGFTSLVDNRVASEFLKKENDFDSVISDKLAKVDLALSETKGDIDASAAEIKKVMTEVESIKVDADETLENLRKQAEELSLLFPNVEKYKNVIDPEFLSRKLHSFDSWEEGASIVVRFEELVKESVSEPARLPAKYIELVGDWCRERNQSHLALYFYKAAIERDPDRMSVMVEYYALQAEVIPSSREESIKILMDLALSGKLKIDVIRRIFNTLMEIHDFTSLASLTSSLIEMDSYKFNNSSLATLYRNNAVALKEDAEYITDEAWLSIKKAVDTNENDENVIKIYASWLLEKRDFENAINQSKKLLQWNPYSASYYMFLSEGLSGQGNHQKAFEVLEYALSIVNDRNDQLQLFSAIKRLPNSELSSILDSM